MGAGKANVLIVDDEQEICRLLRDDLSQEGYLCSTALTGQEALAKLESGCFDVVLLDIKLPDISGIEILKKVTLAYHTAASIVITGIDNVGTVTEAMKCGAADYVVKPFTLDRIRAGIQTVLENVTHSSSTTHPKIPVSFEGARECTVPNDETFQELDAIASGVQTRYDSMLGYSKMITRETVEIARRLGLPEAAIEAWIKARTKQDSERKRDIGCSLSKLARSLPAQELLGLMRPYIYAPENNEREN